MKALDLFCGGGGASVGLNELGYSVTGVDVVGDALATCRELGHRTKFHDLQQPYVSGESFDLVWASPPCTAFSMAGKRKGQSNEGELLKAIVTQDWDWGRRKGVDPEVWLILPTMQSVLAMMPPVVVMENVPQTAEVFGACHQVLRQYGYRGEVGTLSAEQFGVPQTRKRSFLSMGRYWQVQLPEPTHAEFVPERWPEKRKRAAARDVGLAPWKSMGSVLGRTGVMTSTRQHRDDYRMDEPAPTVCAGSSGAWQMKINDMDVTDAGLLQGFRPDHPWQGSVTSIYRKIGNAVPPPMAIAVAGQASGLVWQVILDQYLRSITPVSPNVP